VVKVHRGNLHGQGAGSEILKRDMRVFGHRKLRPTIVYVAGNGVGGMRPAQQPRDRGPRQTGIMAACANAQADTATAPPVALLGVLPAPRPLLVAGG
jgi:hypothetical protein